MKKILLAENDAFLINVYANQLRKSGYITSIAIDGEIVTKRLKNINPDLLILDDALPKIDHVSFLKMIGGNKEFERLKVVMLSSFNREDDFKNVCGFGSVRCFSKADNTAEEIVEEIKKILS